MAQSPAKAEQARQLLRQGKLEQACAIAQRLVQSSPADWRAKTLLSEIHFLAGRAVQALHFAQAAVEQAPGDVGALCHLAFLLTVENRPEEAAAVAERAVALAPGLERPRLVAAGAYGLMRRYSRVIEHCRAGLAANPGSVELGGVLAGALANAGRVEEGFALMQELASRHPDQPQLLSGVCALSNYQADLSPREVFGLHTRYAGVLDRTIPVPPRTFTNAPEPQRRIRVGLVSPDLRSHSVAFFIEPLLRGHDRGAIEISVYQTNRIADAVTKRLRGYGSAWRVMDTATDARLAETIRADAMDIAVELSGHTEAHSLGAMHLRPAPVLASYCGYPNTTGIALDRRIVDSTTDPAGEADSLATEKLYRLDPCFLCYAPPGGANPSPALPSRGGGGNEITFGSFNALQKLNDRVARLWARVLDGVPGSRLVLKSYNLGDEGLHGPILDRFARCGVSRERIELLAPAPSVGEHLAQYAKIDIALDTVPYNGTTTTCEALWMGVPVVAMTGDRHSARVSASLLRCAGLGELVADSEEGYAALAAALAGDPARLASLRASLRERVRSSPLCDEPGFCRRFEGALREMWRGWCGSRRSGA